jgi:hypothetical protein
MWGDQTPEAARAGSRINLKEQGHSGIVATLRDLSF